MNEKNKKTKNPIKRKSDLFKKWIPIETMCWQKKRCHIRIEIDGKTFGRTRQLLRRRINPMGMVYLDGITLKRYKNRKEIIRSYIDKELREYFVVYTKERGLPCEPLPRIGFYDEKKACLDLIFDILYDPFFQTVIGGFVAGFTPWLMDRLLNLLKSNEDKNGNDKRPNITITNIIGDGNTIIM